MVQLEMEDMDKDESEDDSEDDHGAAKVGRSAGSITILLRNIKAKIKYGGFIFETFRNFFFLEKLSFSKILLQDILLKRAGYL